MSLTSTVRKLFVTRYLSIVIVVLGVGASILTVAELISLVWALATCALVLALGLIGQTGWIVFERRRAAPAQAVVRAIRAAIPQAAFLDEFLSSTLFAGRSIPQLRSFDADHHLQRYVKNFRIEGYDIATHEEYHGVNLGPMSSGLKLVSFGGSIINYGELSSHAAQLMDGIRHRVRIDLQEDEERLKIMKLTFVRPIATGEPFEIHYDDFWPRAMVFPVDAVFYTQVLYYARGIAELSSSLMFDTTINSIGAYWYDLESERCGIDNSQPIQVADERAHTTFEWSVHNPANNRLYFILFDRPTIPSRSDGESGTNEAAI